MAKKKMITIDKALDLILGVKGGIVSSSKSLGPAMAVYNAQLAAGDELLWYGDIDLIKTKDILCRLAKLYDVTIDIYYEHDAKVYPFEKGDKSKLQKKKFKKSKPVFSTNKPHLFAGNDFFAVYAQKEKERDANFKELKIYYRCLTPNGTEWTSLNRCYYDGPHYVYRIFKHVLYRYLVYPAKITNDKKLSLVNKIFRYFKFMVKEIKYDVVAIKSKQFTFYEVYLDV